MKKYTPIFIITLGGLFIRLINFTGISLWHDEAFSALLIKYSFPEMIYRIGLDVHPPLYYIFLRFWSYGFGDSLASLRGFSVFFGVATIVAGYLLVKTIFNNEKAALIAALLIAINPFQIQYVSEARMYTMGAFFGVIGAYFLVKALDLEKINAKNPKNDSGVRVMFYLLFATSASIASLTHYYLLFTVIALCGYAFLYTAYLYRFKLSGYISLILSYLFIAGSFSIYIPTFLYQFKQVGAGYWIPPIDRWSIPTTLWTMFSGIGIDITKSRSQILATLITLLSLWIIFKFLKNSKNGHKWLVLFIFSAPFAGSLLFALLAHLKGSSTSVYLVRYFLYASTFYTIMIGVFLANLKNKIASQIILGSYILLCLFSIYHFWDDVKVKERPGMSKAAQYLKANVGPSDKIVVGSSFEFFNYKYYNSRPETDTTITPVLFSGGIKNVHELPHFAGTAILTEQDLYPNFEVAKNGDTIWLLWTNGFGGSKPQVPKNFTQIGTEVSYPDIRPYIGTYIYVTQYKVN